MTTAAKNAMWRMGVMLAVLLPACLCRAEKVADMPQPTSYVVDMAGVIDAASAQQMEALGREVRHKAGATIEVVTIHTLEGEDIEEFTTALEDKWKVGAKGTDKGVIMLFAVNDRKRRIEVGYGLEGVLNDAKVGDIGRSMVDGLRSGAYGPAIFGGERQIAVDIAQDAGVTLDPTVLSGASQPVYPRQRARRQPQSNWVGLLVFVGIFILFAVFARGRGPGGGGGNGLLWFLLGNMLGGGGSRGRWDGDGGGGWRGGDGGGGGGGGDDSDFGGGFGGGSGGGGASGGW